MEFFNSKDMDILHHYIFLGHSQFCYENIIKTGQLKRITEQYDINELVCFSKSGRAVKQDPLLLCVAILYLSNTDQHTSICEGITSICRIPTDLFKLMNIVANGSHLREDFKNLKDVKNFIEMIRNNPLKKKKEKKAEKKTKNGEEDNICEQNGTIQDDNVDEKVWKFVQKHKFIEKWYIDTKKTAVDLLYLMTKYKKRCGWNHKTIIRNGHFKFQGDSDGKCNKKCDEKENDNSKEEVANVLWTGGNCSLVMRYILHGIDRLMEVNAKYRDYFEKDEKLTGINEIDNQVLSAINVLEKSKANYKDDQVEHINRVAELITNFIRTPKIPENLDKITFTVGIKVVDKCEESKIRVAVPGGDLDFAANSTVQMCDKYVYGPLHRFHFCIEHLPTNLYNKKKVRYLFLIICVLCQNVT